MKRLLHVFMLVITLAGCAQAIRPQELRPEGFEPWSDQVAPFTFEPGDEMDIRLIYNPEFSDRVIVAPDGQVHLSLVGSVQASGRSPDQLRDVLRDMYAKELRRPDLAVVPRSFGSNIVYVGGEVRTGGVYNLAPNMGVTHAIMAAGGYLPTARIDEVVLLRRSVRDKPMLKIINLQKALEGTPEEQDLPLRRYDVVFVPRSHIAELNLWIDQHINQVLPFQRSFSYTLQRDIRNPIDSGF